MTLVNLHVGWLAILLGLVAGATIGMFFHRDEWLGGYGGWRRRMLRLVHISLVGTGLLNLAFALSCESLPVDPVPMAASLLFVAGAATMPTVCFLSVWRPKARHLFFIPVVSLIAATGDFIWRGLLR
jgi:hypothetical protein